MRSSVWHGLRTASKMTLQSFVPQTERWATTNLYRDRLCSLLVVTSAIALSSCASLCDSTPTFISLPEPADLIHPGEDLESIVVSEDCAGIYSIRNLQDSWSANLVADGENYVITLTPFASWNNRKSEFPLRPLEIAVRGRGPWSDCFHMMVKVNYRVGPTSLSRAFELDPKNYSRWRPAAH